MSAKGKNKNRDHWIPLFTLLGCCLTMLAWLEMQPVLKAQEQKGILAQMAVLEHDDPFLRKIDFDQLQSLNPDVIGWLYIPDSSVDYPILQGEQDDTYLSLDMTKQPQKCGCITTYHNTAADFSDNVTVLYGHNMSYYQMFGELKRYHDVTFRQNHLIFYLYTPQKTYEIEVFSIFQANVTDEVVHLRTKTHSLSKAMTLCTTLNWYADLPTVVRNQQIFTLMTCVGGHGSSERLLINGVVKQTRS